jgi:hypothetical protein
MGRMDMGYVPPPEDQTPLVLRIINPAFWTIIEIEM